MRRVAERISALLLGRHRVLSAAQDGHQLPDEPRLLQHRLQLLLRASRNVGQRPRCLLRQAVVPTAAQDGQQRVEHARCHHCVSVAITATQPVPDHLQAGDSHVHVGIPCCIQHDRQDVRGDDHGYCVGVRVVAEVCDCCECPAGSRAGIRVPDGQYLAQDAHQLRHRLQPWQRLDLDKVADEPHTILGGGHGASWHDLHQRVDGTAVEHLVPQSSGVAHNIAQRQQCLINNLIRVGLHQHNQGLYDPVFDCRVNKVRDWHGEGCGNVGSVQLLVLIAP
mmetsp:Transcript_32012/g.82921  ORF Transcript_32012/g.82921 Transcript_32012/m.82921 type:complete len:279 (+) Transcript_32012:243-1079(+)